MAKGGQRSTSWKRGQSGNPDGRPKRPATVEVRRIIADVKAAAREMTPKALATLEQVMDDPKAPPAARVGAATAILDRGWGKPKQSIEGQVGLTLERMILMATEREERQAFPAGPSAEDE
jgi:Family of unknown function (DUF5681)